MNTHQLAATLDMLHIHAESAAAAIDEFADKLYSDHRGMWRSEAESMRATARKFEGLIKELRERQTQ
jgi:hypothetical protein